MPAEPSSFGVWEQTSPNLPARSFLYRLAPCGIGTPYVESLGSYITRLAEAHVVSVWRLTLYVLSPIRHGRVSRPSKRYAYPANGLGKDSEILLYAVKTATCRDNLDLLTLCPLRGIVSQPMLFRSVEAWCPACLEEWRTSDRPIYSPLIWALRLVTVCPVHLCALAERCPHCRSSFPPLMAWGRPGSCPACFKWLGSSAARPPGKGLQETDRYARWVATSVGQLLASLPALQQHVVPAVLRMNLLRCLSQTEGATRESFSALSGSSPTTFGAWLSGRIKPSLDQICRLCYQLKLPPLSLFHGVPADWCGPKVFPGRANTTVKHRSRGTRGTRDDIQQTLAGALMESPPPSVAELARRLKYRCTETLRCKEPGFCKAIADRWRRARPHGYKCIQIYTKTARAKLQSALRAYLSQKNPPSLNCIAFLLGYKSSTSIRERCPAICQEIMQKRRMFFQRQREQMRRALVRAHAQEPPPPLKQIARRLGFTAEGVLKRAYPEISTAYMAYRKAWFEQKRQRMCLRIRYWLATEPAPTRTSLSMHFGISLAYLEKHFPQENREVVMRSAEKAEKACEYRHRATRNEVFEIVRYLKAKRLYPSLPRVRSLLSSRSLRSYRYLRPAIDEALSRLGPAIRARNELGQFV